MGSLHEYELQALPEVYANLLTSYLFRFTLLDWLPTCSLLAAEWSFSKRALQAIARI